MTANVSLTFAPSVHKFMPLTSYAGIEYLTIEFPLTPYPGHLQASSSVFSHSMVECINLGVMVQPAN
jgi:hypothetical protein